MVKFSHVDHVSHLRLPWGTSFVAEDGSLHRVYGVSALTLAPDMVTLLALCDRSKLLRAKITFNLTTLALDEVKWIEERDLIIGENGSPQDMEGMAMLSNGMLYASSEPYMIWELPREQDWPKSGAVHLEPHARVPSYIRSRVRHNRGIESLSSYPLLPMGGSKLLAGFEGALTEDAFTVRRLFEFDADSGNVRCQKLLFIPESHPHLYLTELAPLDGYGLCDGGQFLALLRGWSPEQGNDIRLYAVDSRGADDISQCSCIIDTESFPLPKTPPTENWCALQGIQGVRGELLFKWTPEMPLAGFVPVDNYEGMAIVPPAALGRQSLSELGGVVVLLVNDDNDSPKQIGTQFVVMRLAFEEPRARPTVNASRSVVLEGLEQPAWVRHSLAPDTGGLSSIAVAIVGLLLLLLLVVVPLFGLRNRVRFLHSRRGSPQSVPIDVEASDREVHRGECGGIQEYLSL